MSPDDPSANPAAAEHLKESDALHERVRTFAKASLNGEVQEERFEELALEIARFQAKHIPGYARLVESRGVLLERFESLVAVPTDVFRLTRVALHPAELDVATFHTSGTTAALSGKHHFRTLKTYEELSLAYGRRALTSAFGGQRVVVALAPAPSQAPHSSLGHMLSLFMNRWDGRALSVAPRGAVYDPESSARWLGGSGGIDLEGLRRAALVALERQEPLLILATSFALVAMLDGLAGAQVPAPKRTVVMYTGGFKGRSREVNPEQLRREVARVFRIPEAQVTGEYGMTELTSQLYEGTLPGSDLSAPMGVYLEPPWLRVVPVDPVSLKPVPSGESGLAKIIDIGNVDSAVGILTQDLVRRVPVDEGRSGIELLGRRKGSPARGCSLSFESW
ncbi:MAG: acyl-protein synthetase, partial [Myxococcales bacterium]|nr:acyl-protein synthetase [Myxococcales bacterium]